MRQRVGDFEELQVRIFICMSETRRGVSETGFCACFLGRLHAKGIEVFLDVAYNHTAEGDDKDPYVISFRGIENKTYYMMTGEHVSAAPNANAMSSQEG